MKYLFPFREYSQSYFSSVKSSLPTTLFQALRSRVNGGNYFSLPINATFMGQYEMYIPISASHPSPPLFAKRGVAKQSKLILLKQIRNIPCPKRGERFN